MADTASVPVTTGNNVSITMDMDASTYAAVVTQPTITVTFSFAYELPPPVTSGYSLDFSNVNNSMYLGYRR